MAIRVASCNILFEDANEEYKWEDRKVLLKDEILSGPQM